MPVIKLFANLRKLAGTKELSIAGATVREVMNRLAEQNPLLHEALLKDDGIRPHVVITVNGRNVIDLNAEINEQDVVAIFPPIAGGQGEKNDWLV